MNERKILYKVESGSKMYGTTTPESDTDYTSVFLPTSFDLQNSSKKDARSLAKH